MLKLSVQPRSSRNQILPQIRDELKIKLTAPPVDNKANASCIQLLSKELKLRKGAIMIVQGQKSKKKTLKIEGSSLQAIEKAIDRISGLLL